jgi:hypothetical protein
MLISYSYFNIYIYIYIMINNDKGIILNGKNIKYISGPTSFYILKKENKYIFLFGDQHNEDNSLCDNCKIDNKCAIIWSDFLDLLNNEAKNYRKINFYCEFPIYDEKENIDIDKYNFDINISVIKNVNKYVVYCNNQNIYNDKCIYKNIEWIGCDIRQNNYNKIKYLENLKSIYTFIKTFYKINKKTIFSNNDDIVECFKFYIDY